MILWFLQKSSNWSTFYRTQLWEKFIKYLVSLNKNPPSPVQNFPLTRGGGLLRIFFSVYFPLKNFFRFAEIFLIQGGGYYATQGKCPFFLDHSFLSKKKRTLIVPVEVFLFFQYIGPITNQGGYWSVYRKNTVFFTSNPISQPPSTPRPS